MNPVLQILADALFFAVFILLFIALSIYIGKAVYDFVKSGKPKQPEHKEHP